MFREGLLVVVSGPSGTGKGTILEITKEKTDNVKFSISATTRLPRQGEVDGKNYFFKSVDEFNKMIEDDQLIEWVKYCDNYYGTPKQYVDECIKKGYDVILEIEVEGALNIKKKYPECVSIFILPPSFAELRKRIEGRGTEKSEIIEMRMEKAKSEMQLVDSYDYVIVNDNIQEAVEQLRSILKAEKLKIKRNKDILNEIGG